MMIFYYILFIAFSPLLALGSEYTIKSKGIIDVLNGKIITNKLIHIKNNRIISIDEKNYSKSKLIDLSNSYILPGLFDCHAHLFLALSDHETSISNALIKQSHLDPNFRINRAKQYLKEYLKQGFTGVCDLGNSGHFLDVKLKKAIQKSPDAFPNYFVSGPSISTGNAQFVQKVNPEEIKREYTIVNNNTNTNKLLNEYLKRNVDILKIILDGSKRESEIFPTKILNEILNSPLISKFKKITFHSTSLVSYEIAKKYKLKNIEHLTAFENDKNEIKFVTNTIMDNQTLKKYKVGYPMNVIIQKNLVKYIHQNNIKPIFGPDFYFQEGENLSYRPIEVKRSILTMSKYGMSNIEILQSMTINPALSMNLSHEMGQIETGFLANLIAVPANPLLDISKLLEITFVMNNGKIIDLK